MFNLVPLARAWWEVAHPDGQGKLIGEALDILSDPLKKSLYDEGYDKAAIEERAAAAAGRDPASVGMEGRVDWAGDGDAIAAAIAAWKTAGATHLSVNTMKAGLATVDDHLAALERIIADLA